LKRFNFHKKALLQHSDEELMGKYGQTGDPEWLGELFRRHMHLVYGVCLKYLNNREDSKDAVMQVFEKLHQDLHKQQVANFKAWLYVVTKNHCLMQLRQATTDRRKKENFLLTGFMESEPEWHPFDEPSDNGLENKLKNCIEKLNKEQKSCIELFFYKKLCYKEIAEQTQMPLIKIKSHIQNGKRNLKICIESSDR
jgi:RNA polymerase sigma-70 factor, ECF subfamily